MSNVYSTIIQYGTFFVLTHSATEIINKLIEINNTLKRIEHYDNQKYKILTTKSDFSKNILEEQK